MRPQMCCKKGLCKRKCFKEFVFVILSAKLVSSCRSMADQGQDFIHSPQHQWCIQCLDHIFLFTTAAEAEDSAVDFKSISSATARKSVFQIDSQVAHRISTQGVSGSIQQLQEE